MGCAGRWGFGARLATLATLQSVVLMKLRKSDSDIDAVTANASSTISLGPFLRATIALGTIVYTDEYDIYARVTHRGISQEKLPLYLAFFQFVHNRRKRGKALLNSLVERLLA